MYDITKIDIKFAFVKKNFTFFKSVNSHLFCS